MGHGQMLRVSMADGWLNRPRGTEPARPDPRAQGDCVIIRSHSEDCRRSAGESGGSGPLSGAKALRLHLVMIPPGTRGLPHFHEDCESAVYVVSGEADVWHGTGLVNRSAVSAGDFIYVPPGTPHLTVNRGEVTSIAVVTRTGPADQADAVVIELPRHLTALLSYPVAVGE
jgi:uncharacterized RmlC-like cupin family protein